MIEIVTTVRRHKEQLQFDLESYCWSFLFMLPFLHKMLLFVRIHQLSYTSLAGEEEEKTAIKTNFKFMAARIKWIFVRKMILKQDTHCKCVIACAAVASCCWILLFWHMLNEPSHFPTNLLRFVCNFSCLFVFFSLVSIFLSLSRLANSTHAINILQEIFYFILSSNICDDDVCACVCGIRVNGVGD